MADWEIERVLATPLGGVVSCTVAEGRWGAQAISSTDEANQALLFAYQGLLDYAGFPTGEFDTQFAGWLNDAPVELFYADPTYLNLEPLTGTLIRRATMGAVIDVVGKVLFARDYIKTFADLLDATARRRLLTAYIGIRDGMSSAAEAQAELWSEQETYITETIDSGSGSSFEDYSEFFAYVEAAYQAVQIELDPAATAALSDAFVGFAQVLRLYDSPDPDAAVGAFVVGLPGGGLQVVNNGPISITTARFVDGAGEPVLDPVTVEPFSVASTNYLPDRNLGEIVNLELDVSGALVRIPWGEAIYTPLYVSPASALVEGSTVALNVDVVSSTSYAVEWSAGGAILGTGDELALPLAGACPGPVAVRATVVAGPRTATRSAAYIVDTGVSADWTVSGGYGAVPPGVERAFSLDAPYATPTAVRWVFGDGATATGNTATHTYVTEGTYTVTATVDDPSDSCAPLVVSDRVSVGRSDTWILLPSVIDNTFTLRNDVGGYIVPATGVVVRSSGRLVAEPGAQVRVLTTSNPNRTDRGFIRVEGELELAGTSAAPILITSSFDPEVGGSGGALFAPGAWTGFVVPAGGAASFSNVEVRYARTAIDASGGTATLSDVIIADAIVGLAASGSNGSVSVSSSSIAATTTAVTFASGATQRILNSTLSAVNGVDVAAAGRLVTLDGVNFAVSGTAVITSPTGSNLKTLRSVVAVGAAWPGILVTAGSFPSGLTVWGADLPYIHSPYWYSTPTWVIPSTAQLVLLPGASVIADDTSTVNSSRSSEIIVEGALALNGTAAAGVSLSGHNGERWAGISTRAGGSVDATHTLIKDSTNGISATGASIVRASGLEVIGSSTSAGTGLSASGGASLLVDSSNLSTVGVAVALSNAGSVTFSDSVVSGAGVGISALGSSTVTLARVSFTSVNLEISTDLTSAGIAMNGNAATDDLGVHRISTGGITAPTAILVDSDFPIIQTITTSQTRWDVGVGASLSFAPGSDITMGRIQNNSGTYLGTIRVAGVLNLDGTESSPITIHGVADASRQWGEIQLTGTASISHATISGATTGVAVSGAGAAVLFIATIRNAQTAINISGELPGGTQSSALTMDRSSITGVATGVSNSTSRLTDARRVWWGSSTGPNTSGASPTVGGVQFTPWCTNPSCTAFSDGSVLDTEPPVITGVPDRAPNDAGWYSLPVVISWSVSDPSPSAGLAELPAPVTAADNGRDIEVTSREVCDLAGLCSIGVATVSVDRTAPGVAVVGVADGAVVSSDQTPTVTCVASDELSGVDGPCSVSVALLSSTVESVVYSVSASARDIAGNTAVTTMTYTVVTEDVQRLAGPASGGVAEYPDVSDDGSRILLRTSGPEVLGVTAIPTANFGYWWLLERQPGGAYVAHNLPHAEDVFPLTISGDGRYAVSRDGRFDLDRWLLNGTYSGALARPTPISSVAQISDSGRYVFLTPQGGTLTRYEMSGAGVVGQIPVATTAAGTAANAVAWPLGGSNSLSSWTDGASDDGTRVVFLSAATHLHPGAIDGSNNFYVKDLASGELFLLPGAPAGISGDGTTVLLHTTEALIVGDTDQRMDVYSFELATRRISIAPTPTGLDAAINVSGVDISDDANFVTFDDNRHIYIWNRSTGQAVRAVPTEAGQGARISGDGSTLVFSSGAGLQSVSVARLAQIDSTPPTVTAAVNAQANGSGWYRVPVTVSWTVDDPSAQVPQSVTVSTEGSGQIVTSSPSCDPSGNCGTGQVTLSIDRTSPTVSLPDPVVIASDADFGVAFAGLSGFSTDSISGVASESCSIPVGTRLGHGYRSVTCTATDVAGNTATRITRLLVVGPVDPESPFGPSEISPVAVGSTPVTDGTATHVLQEESGPGLGRVGLYDLTTGQRTPIGAGDADLDVSSTELETLRPVSSNGRFAVFMSNLTNLDLQSPANTSQGYVRDLLAGETIAIPYPVEKVVAVSDDGMAVLFWSMKPNLVSPQIAPSWYGGALLTYRSTYIWHRDTGDLIEVGPGDPAAWGDFGVLSYGASSADLSRVVVRSATWPYVIEPGTGREVRLVGVDGGEYDKISLSTNGRWAVVITTSNRDPLDRGGVPDVYRLDVDDLLAGGDGDPVWISRRSPDVPTSSDGNCVLDGLNQVCHGAPQNAMVSDDGNIVAFTATASHDQARDFPTPNAQDVYVRDVGAGTTSLLSHDPENGVYGNTNSNLVGLSRDGHRAVFVQGNRYITRSITPSDVTAPVVVGHVSPVVSAAGWLSGVVTVSWSCTDGESGVESCPAPVVVSTEGADQLVVSEPACDVAGNCAVGSVVVSIDSTLPSAVAVLSPALNVFGWSALPVTVSWLCNDDLSGVASCPEPTVLSEGAGQVVTGVVTDAAGNSATVSSVPVGVDETAPLLSGVAAGSSNAAGWFAGDVTIVWSCSDALSGIDGVCPADSTISGEGVGLNAAADVSDLAGNVRHSLSESVRIDRTAPVTSADVWPGWSSSDVLVLLSADDNLSGVASTWFRVDGGDALSGSVALVSGSGVHTLEFWSVDVAGNVEGVQLVSVLIDVDAPSISHSQSPVANVSGWTNAATTVTFVCSAGVSGVASCTAPVTVSTEGAGQPVVGTAVSNAGVSVSETVELNIDVTGPSITGEAIGALNAAGWFDGPVTVRFTCDDALSGVATCPNDVTLTASGAGRSVTGVAVDAAGNSSSVTVSGINIDRDVPTITASATASANAAGWFNGPVTVHFECGDDLSGVVSCPADVTLSADGFAQSVSGTVVDVAGNVSTVTVSGINIDQTAPVVSLAYTGGLPVCAASDVLSGLSGVCVVSVPVEGSPGVFSVTGTATDVAGNVTVGSLTYTSTTLTDRQEVITIIGQLSALNLTGNNDKARDKAIISLNKALTSNWWNATGTAPSASNGTKVFNEFHGALQELFKITGNPQATQLANDLMAMSRQWTVDAIDAAIARNGNPASIAQAQQQLALGDQKAAQNSPGDAINAYRQAWDKATKA
ncbi:MAG: PKD domain-containing protein [Ilumatobacteraceae bacterium]